MPVPQPIPDRSPSLLAFALPVSGYCSVRIVRVQEQVALGGMAATDECEIVFDCLRGSRKYANVERDPAFALVVG